MFSSLIGWAIAALAGLGGVLAVFFTAKKAAGDAFKVQQAKKEAKARVLVNQALAGAPGRKEELVDRLKKGGRL